MTWRTAIFQWSSFLFSIYTWLRHKSWFICTRESPQLVISSTVLFVVMSSSGENNDSTDSKTYEFRLKICLNGGSILGVRTCHRELFHEPNSQHKWLLINLAKVQLDESPSTWWTIVSIIRWREQLSSDISYTADDSPRHYQSSSEKGYRSCVTITTKSCIALNFESRLSISIEWNSFVGFTLSIQPIS